MSVEVFETPGPEEVFQPYAPVKASTRHSRMGMGPSPEVEGHFHDKSMMELDEHELSAAQAFEVFMGKVYKPTLPKQTEYELSAGKSSSKTKLESPLARFTRLSLELKELEADLTLLAADAQHKKHKILVDAGQEAELNEVLEGLNTLQLNLSTLEENTDFQPFLRAVTAGANADAALSLQKDLTAKFFKQIDAIKRQEQGQTAETSVSESAPIVYEIYSNGELNAIDRDAKTRMATLEARISTLERAVGSFQSQELDDLTSLGGASTADLTSIMTHLEQRVALMSEKNLDAVKTRTSALVHELTLISKLKQSAGAQGSLNSQTEREQIQKIYDQLSSLNTVAASVPNIVDRLVALKSVHDEALDITARMDKIEHTQASLGELLDSDAALLADMEASLAENVQLFQSNIQELDDRMAKLLSSSGVC